jgi:hypothetical protein
MVEEETTSNAFPNSTKGIHIWWWIVVVVMCYDLEWKKYENFKLHCWIRRQGRTCWGKDERQSGIRLDGWLLSSIRKQMQSKKNSVYSSTSTLCEQKLLLFLFTKNSRLHFLGSENPFLFCFSTFWGIVCLWDSFMSKVAESFYWDLYIPWGRECKVCWFFILNSIDG